MGILSQGFDTLRVRLDDDICFIQLYRPNAGNAINDRMVTELDTVLAACEPAVKVVVLEGLPEVFCAGADFEEIRERVDGLAQDEALGPGPLYDVWHRLAHGPYISIAHVRGRANAGGVGFVAACDVVLSDDKAVFSLSELLFGLMPACVLPFLIRRVGQAKANYLTLMTQPITAAQAEAWGLVDGCEANSENLLRKKLLRLRLLGKAGIVRYKRYVRDLDATLAAAREPALAANREVFSDPDNLARVARYVRTGKLPWEAD